MKLFLKIIILIVIFLPFLCLADEGENEVKYNKNPHNFKRGYTPSKYKINKNWHDEKLSSDSRILLPEYEDIASNKEKGITLDDWKSFLLSEKTFRSLDTMPPGGDEILSQEELQNHKFMGKAKKYTQGKDLIKKVCEKISGYEERLEDLKRRGFDIKPVDYYLDGNPKIEDKCEHPDCNEVWTKEFITIENGKIKKTRVCLGHYVLMLMEQDDRENVNNAYIFGVILLALVVAVTALLPAFIK